MANISQSKRLLALLAAVFFTAHFIFQFLAWTQHPGNSAIVGRGSTLPWSVSSFPLFALLGNSLSTEFFWIVLIANSAIWSAGLTWFTALVLRRSR